VPIDPDLVRALAAWRTLFPARGDDDFVFVDRTGALIERHEAAEMFRADLLTAKVDRAELHDTSSPLRRQVRLHDLRASMVTTASPTAGPRNGSGVGPATRRARSSATGGSPRPCANAPPATGPRSTCPSRKS
jgi:hypothetical protein